MWASFGPASFSIQTSSMNIQVNVAPLTLKLRKIRVTLTLKRRHLVLRDGKLQASFMAKGGKRVRRQIANRTLMRALEKIRDLPGADLLTWLDAAATQSTN